MTCTGKSCTNFIKRPFGGHGPVVLVQPPHRTPINSPNLTMAVPIAKQPSGLDMLRPNVENVKTCF